MLRSINSVIIINAITKLATIIKEALKGVLKPNFQPFSFELKIKLDFLK